MSKKPAQKILLVDDDKDMCESLSDVLTLDSSYDVAYATDPFKALEMVQSEDYALIIIDYKMPGMNGVELLVRMKKVKPSIPIFMLTAFISNELIEQAKKEGASKVLSKFIWPDEILKHIREAVKT